MKIDEFKTEVKDGKLYVYVEVAHCDHLRGIPKEFYKTGNVKKALDEKNIKYGSCIKESLIKNWRHATRKGEWIFEIPVDKPAEPVIIEEEKSVKPRRTRRTRSSTTKVSTEE